MQLLHDNKAILMAVRDINMNANITIKDSSHNVEVKEKRSSDGSLLLMNPVASGDNVATGLNSSHKIKEELPALVPCCEGRELQINEDLVRTGLSAISVKHDNMVQCLSMSRACEKLQVPPGLVKHRNSFRCLHRPDLKRVPYLRRMTSDELESLFRGYADLPTKFIKCDDAEGTTKFYLHPIEQRPAIETKRKEDGAVNALHPIPETRSGAEDVPAGMRLHGARARLYTSVLAGARAGDQLESLSTDEELDVRVPTEIVPEDEIQLAEELQIILPPRCDDVTAGSSTTASTDQSIY
ncbi:hypothetical protein K1T71_001699 [Dendrolimus kikuchii]|uniref:Uncharacterized protein n=1 Tax=Dendrolimus kikuchii TaxID=765133 RepID=A0ACC1DET7_9NEOP|nr:hypothetical protein K1T71_001699 [Dendrolimus kikuchii]